MCADLELQGELARYRLVNFASNALTAPARVLWGLVNLADPKIEAKILDLGGVPMPMTPAEFGQLLAHETEKWAKVIRAANIKAN